MRTFLCFSLLFVAIILATVLSTGRSTSAPIKTETAVILLQCTSRPPGMVSWSPGEANAKDIRCENTTRC
jgi:hypothetical protein